MSKKEKKLTIKPIQQLKTNRNFWIVIPKTKEEIAPVYNTIIYERKNTTISSFTYDSIRLEDEWSIVLNQNINKGSEIIETIHSNDFRIINNMRVHKELKHGVFEVTDVNDPVSTLSLNVALMYKLSTAVYNFLKSRGKKNLADVSITDPAAISDTTYRGKGKSASYQAGGLSHNLGMTKIPRVVRKMELLGEIDSTLPQEFADSHSYLIASTLLVEQFVIEKLINLVIFEVELDFAGTEFYDFALLRLDKGLGCGDPKAVHGIAREEAYEIFNSHVKQKVHLLQVKDYLQDIYIKARGI